MKTTFIATLVLASGIAFAASGEEADKQMVSTEQETGFRGWRLSVGGSMAFGIKASAGFNLSRAYGATDPIIGGVQPNQNYSFDGGAYINAGEEEMTYGPSVGTRNWSIPESFAPYANGARSLNFSNTQLENGGVGGSSDDGSAFGVSVELAKTLFKTESGFGMDVAVGLSWMMANDIINATSYGAYNQQMYSYRPSNGTPLSDPNAPSVNGAFSGEIIPDGPSGAYIFYDNDFLGGGNQWTDSNIPGTYSMHAKGDYQEIELSLMLKPWYEITDWWRVNGTIGAGMGYSIFDLEMNAMLGPKGVYRMSDTENKLGFYGLVGGGTTFRIGRFDLSGEVLVRLFQDDISAGNGDAYCELEKPDFVVRVALGMQF